MVPGEIYKAKLKSGKLVPVIVISRSDLNLGDSSLCVMTTTYRFDIRKDLANCVPLFNGKFGIAEDCVAQCNNILSIDHADLDTSNGPIGMLDRKTHRKIIKAVGFALIADCVPE